MARPKLTLYLDVVSPFAYMAFFVTRSSPMFKQVDISYVPLFLGGVMKACNNRPPLEIKNKAQWIEKDRLRWCRQFSIPISEETPEPFPQLTLGAQRALCAVSLLHPDKLIACFEALYQAFWVEGQTISKAEVFGPVFLSVLGDEKGKEVLEAAGKAEAKKLLTDNTKLAVQEGAFGLPWFVATNSKGEKEGFWGFDHLGQVIDHLGLERKEDGLRAML